LERSGHFILGVFWWRYFNEYFVFSYYSSLLTLLRSISFFHDYIAYQSNIMADNLMTTPPSSKSFLLSYPIPFVLQVTINRERAMNSIDSAGHWEAEGIFDWYDQEPSLRVAIITGIGKRSFCAGADLIEQGRIVSPSQNGTGVPHKAVQRYPPGGFAGISLATHRKKPIIAAVNGYALGGGFEIVLNW
jgi:enoyl-CoA hydratase/carnithine racemase